MSKHTPGPWQVRMFPTARGGLDCWWVLDSIPDSDGRVVANAVCSLTMSNEDADANARLIAAAPELLEACKAMLGVLDGGTWVTGGMWPATNMRAAIAKAEGK